MMKKIVFLVAVCVLVSVAQTYDIYDVNGKHYGKISGQIDKNTIDRYVQAAHGSVLVWKKNAKKKLFIKDAKNISKDIELSQDSLDKVVWIELEKNEKAKICLDSKVLVWETSIESKILNDSCLIVQTPDIVGSNTISLYNDMSKYQINIAIGMKYLKFENDKVALGFDTHPLPIIGSETREEDPKRIVALTAEYLVDKYPVTNCEMASVMKDSIPEKSPAFNEYRKKISNQWSTRKNLVKKGNTCIAQDSAANGLYLLQAMEYANQRSIQEGLEPYYVFSNAGNESEKIVKKGDYVIPYLDFSYHKEKNIHVSVNEKSAGYRLPYYDEWMIFARGGDLKNDAPWGDSSARVEEALEYAWFGAKESEIDFNRASKPVGLLKPNGYGLYDVFGLVEEFVLFESQNPFSLLQNKPSCKKGGDYWTVLSHQFGKVDVGPYWKWINYGYASPNYAGGMGGFRLVRKIR